MPLRRLSLLLLLLASGPAWAQANFRLAVGGDTLDIAPGQSLTHVLPSGEALDLTLIEKDILTYRDSVVTFSYPRGISVSTTTLEEGILQVMAMSALGEGVLIQEYTGLNPSFLVSLMLNEVTKEEANFGAKMETEDVAHTLRSGQEMEGRQAVLTLDSETRRYAVYGYGTDRGGILLVTMSDDAYEAERDDFIGTILSSLSLRENG